MATSFKQSEKGRIVHLQSVTDYLVKLGENRSSSSWSPIKK